MPVLTTIDSDGFFATNIISTNWIITRTGQLVWDNGTGFASSGRVRMTVEGVVAGSSGIDLLQGYFDAPSYITITETGLVAGWGSGTQGIDYYFAGSELTNAGTVVGTTAVRFTDGTDIVVSNSGDILGQDTVSTLSKGIEIGAGSGGLVLNSGLIEGDIGIHLSGAVAAIENSGIIRGLDPAAAAIQIDTVTSDTIVITNTGTIQGPTAILAPGAAMSVFNEGVISGAVTLSGEQDVFRGRDGLLLGEIDGGAGNDRLITGRGDDIVLGGNGNDVIRGGAGEDVLFGDGGEDVLSGGADDDTLTGGGKGDSFVFRPGGGDDVVTDFGSGADVLDLRAFGFGAFADINGLASNTGFGLLIDLERVGGGSILLQGVLKADFDAGDVLF